MVPFSARSSSFLSSSFLASGRTRGQNARVSSAAPPPVTRTPFEVRLPEGRLEAVRLTPREVRAGLSPVRLPARCPRLHLALARPPRSPLRGARPRRARLRPSRVRAIGGAPRAPGPRFLEVEATERLPEVLRQAGMTRPVLFGHSDGASIALLFAAAFPSVPAAVVSIAAHVFIEDVTLSGIDETVEAWESTDLPARLARHHGEKTEAVFRGWSETWRNPAFRGFSAVEAIRSIRCPVLVLQGENDEYGTVAQVDAIASAVSGPVRRLVLPGLGHFPHREDPGRVLAETERFLADFGA